MKNKEKYDEYEQVLTEKVNLNTSNLLIGIIIINMIINNFIVWGSMVTQSLVIIILITTYNLCLMIKNNVSVIKQRFWLEFILYIAFVGGVITIINHIVNIINNGFSMYITNEIYNSQIISIFLCMFSICIGSCLILNNMKIKQIDN